MNAAALAQAAQVNAVPQAEPGHGWHQLAVLAALMGFASISTDLYLPAMPAMARALGASAGSVEWSISGYLIGFSLGQLLWGSIGDRYGRRLPVAAGLVLFVAGSAGCALSGSLLAMVAWRVVQALGACASVVLARAMVRDLYSGARAAQMISTLMTVMAVAPLLGPLVGGQILAWLGWRAIFWVLVGVGGATLAALFTVPETLAPERRRTEPLGRALLGYGALLRDPATLAYIGAGGFFYGGMFAFIAGSPFAYVTYHHVSPQAYGLLFALSVVGIMVANLANARLVPRIGSDRLIRWGTAGGAAAGLVLAVTARTGWGGLLGLVLPLFAFASANGFIVAKSIAGALSRRPDRAGARWRDPVRRRDRKLSVGRRLRRWNALADGVGDCRDGPRQCPQWLGVVAMLTCRAYDIERRSTMKNVIVLIGAGSIGQAIVRRVSAGKHVLLADLRIENADAAAKTLGDAGFEVSTATVNVSSRASVHALVETATALGEVSGVVHAAGVSPSQASPETILKVDLYGTALVLEEFGNVIARNGAGVVIASQSGHRLPPLSAEQNALLATTPVEELLALPMLQPDQVKDSLHAYQLSKRGNSLRVMAEAVRWGKRGARVNTISPGIIITPLANDELKGPRGPGYRRMMEASAAGRAGTPDEVGTVGALLMGANGAFITGSDILMDGGVTVAYWFGELAPQ